MMELPPPDWLCIAAEVIRLRSPDLFGGPFYPIYARPKPAWFKDEYGTFSLGDDGQSAYFHRMNT